MQVPARRIDPRYAASGSRLNGETRGAAPARVITVDSAGGGLPAAVPNLKYHADEYELDLGVSAQGQVGLAVGGVGELQQGMAVDKSNRMALMVRPRIIIQEEMDEVVQRLAGAGRIPTPKRTIRSSIIRFSRSRSSRCRRSRSTWIRPRMRMCAGS